MKTRSKQGMFPALCIQCRKPFRRMLMKCPRCMHRNGGHPIILIGKVAAVVVLVAAIWYIAKVAVQTDDTASGVIRSTPTPAPAVAPDPSRSHLYPTPTVTPVPDPRFPR